MCIRDRHYEEGLRRYNLAEYDSAIEEFKQSYALAPLPLLLFNLAQAHRMKKNYEQAVNLYRNYLRNQPDAQNRADVEELITKTEEALQAQRKAQADEAS